MKKGLSTQDAEAMLYGIGLKNGMTATEARWLAVDNAEGLEIWTRREATRKNLEQATAHNPTARKTTNTSYAAPLTRRQQAALTLLCVLGVLVTAAVGLLFMFWSYLQ